jgi:hypothetical protein
VFGPGQVAWEGATGAISSFAARALGRRGPHDPRRPLPRPRFRLRRRPGACVRTDRVRRVLGPDSDTRPRRDDAAPRGGPARRRRRRHGRARSRRPPRSSRRART